MSSTPRVTFGVITDAHVGDLADVQGEYLRAAIRKIARDPLAFVVFAGDMVDVRAKHIDGQWLVEMFESIMVPLYFLKGNTDAALTSGLGEGRFEFTRGGYAFIGFDTSNGTLSNEEDQWLQQQLRAHHDRRIVLFTHCYVNGADFDPDASDRIAQHMDQQAVVCLISGHGHRSESYTVGRATQHLVAAIDPCKPGSHVPGYERFTLEGDALRRERGNVSLITQTAYADLLSHLSCAARHTADLDGIEQMYEQDGLRSLQCSSRMIQQLGGPLAIECIADWHHGGQISHFSMHVSNLKIDANGVLMNSDTFARELEECQQIGAEAINSHLPLCDERALFDEKGSITDNATAQSRVAALADALEGFWRAGIRIELENTHWYDPVKAPESFGEHQLGIKIYQLLYFREQLERELLGRCGQIDGAAVRFCLDVGHALTNGPLVKEMTVQDWFTSLAPNVSAIHFHDVVEHEDGTRQAHYPLGAEGGIVGLEGFIYLKQRFAPAALLHIEVAELSEVRSSIEYLRGWGRANGLKCAVDSTYP